MPVSGSKRPNGTVLAASRGVLPAVLPLARQRSLPTPGGDTLPQGEIIMIRQYSAIIASAALLAFCSTAQADMTLWATPSGDGTYAWNSKYGPYGYGQGGAEMGVGLGMGGQYGNDYTVSVFMIPLAGLAGQTPTTASLVVDSLGFGTGYYYGSASIGWLDTGSATLTGDFVADGLGPAASGRPGGYSIYNSDYTDTPGLKSFDVTSHVLQDISAGRLYSTFVLSGSRDTYGALKTAETASGPRMIVTGVVPEPASLTALGMGLTGLIGIRRRKHL